MGGLLLATVVTSDPHPPSTPRNFWKLPLAIGFWGCHFSGTGIDNSIFAGVSVVIANPLVTFVHDIQSHNERHITVTLGDPTNPPRRQNLVWMPRNQPHASAWIRLQRVLAGNAFPALFLRSTLPYEFSGSYSNIREKVPDGQPFMDPVEDRHESRVRRRTLSDNRVTDRLPPRRYKFPGVPRRWAG